MDIDIDFADRKLALDKLKHIVAGRKTPAGLIKHNTGIYVQSIPYNPITEISTIDYKDAELRKYFKIDFLNVSVYEGVRDRQHLIHLTNQEPLWELLEQDDFCNLLFHVNGHGNILREMKPKTISQLAAVLAMIRPAKRYLVGKSSTPVMNEIWEIPTTGEYFFKKSHAHSYAMLVVVHMNLLCENLANEASLRAEPISVSHAS